MKQYYIIIALSFIAMNAADSSDIVTFYTESIEKTSGEHLVRHFVPWDMHIAGKTFKELFTTNAVAYKIPWIVNVHSIEDKWNRCFDYFDIVQQLKEKKDISDISSHSRATAACIEIAAKIVDARYKDSIKSTSDIHIFYYDNAQKFMPSHFFDTSYAQTVSGNLANGQKINMSDLSCTLAIALHNDYSQLLPIIAMFITQAKTAEPVIPKLNFWVATFVSLPKKRRDQLHKEFKELFGITIIIPKESE